MIRILIPQITIYFVLLILVHYQIHEVRANSVFRSNYPCHDSNKYCVASGERIVEGVKVRRDCWEWAYDKICQYPSKSDCSQYSHCYSLGQRGCYLRDSLGNCINLKKEFSCKRRVPVNIESKTIRYGVEEKDGQEGLICKGIPCIDGNCIDKSYEMDEEMMQSVSQLYALSQGKSDGHNFKIFEGANRHCSKKPADYSNCCRVEMPGKGWGSKIGHKCTADENYLMEQRKKNLCVYVGKRSSKTMGITTVNKRYFCCFNNMIEKTIQIQGRKQLGLNFGSGGNPDCRGLTLEELERIDWSKIDFSEVAAEIKQRMVLPKDSDVEMRVKDSLSGINEFDHNKPLHETNKKAGINAVTDGGDEDESYY